MGILGNLEELTKRETLVARTKKEMDRGEIWVYPVELKKGNEYSVRAACSGKGAVNCALYDSEEKKTLAQSGPGKQASLSLTAEEDGIFTLRTMLEPSGTDFGREKVTVTIRKSYIPSRLKAWAVFE